MDEDTSLADLMDDDTTEAGRASVMATFDVGGGGSASWRLSAKPEVKLAALLEISNSLGKALSVEEILPKLLDSLFKIFVQADRGFVVMRPKPDGPLVPVAVKNRREGDEQRMRISRTIVEEAMKSRKAILSADAASDERFGMAQSIADFSIRSMICAPMIGADGEPLGVIQIDTLNQKSRFTDEDLEVLAGVASQAAVSIDNAKMHEQVVAQQALQRDLELARRMQRALLPSQPPQVPGYCFFDYYQSARQVGGDYYDYVQLPGGRFAVIVGDVAGKGVSAALLMARLSSDVRFLLASEPDPAKAVQQINEGFANADWQDQFVTMIVAVLNPHTHELTIVNAGHMAPLLRRNGGTVEAIGESRPGCRSVWPPRFDVRSRPPHLGAGRRRHDLHRRLQRSHERRTRTLRPGAADGAGQLAGRQRGRPRPAHSRRRAPIRRRLRPERRHVPGLLRESGVAEA